MVDRLDITQNLKLLGLNEKEVRIYTILLFEGKMSILSLAQKTNIPRSSVYRICQNLSDKKFLKIFQKDSTKVKAILPKELRKVLQAKENEIKLADKALYKLQSLIPFPIKKLPGTEVRYYQGKEGIKQVIWNTLNAKDTIVGYSVCDRDTVVGKSFIEKYNEVCVKRNIKDKVIVNTKALRKSIQVITSIPHYEYQNVKVFDENTFYISGDTYIYNDIFAVNFGYKDEIIGIEIKNKEIANIQKGIFYILWEMAEPIEDFMNNKS